MTKRAERHKDLVKKEKEKKLRIRFIKWWRNFKIHTLNYGK